jgi:hypothetical protein
MKPKSFHIPDEDLVLAADNELPPHRAGEVRGHLSACWNCRVRMAEIEATIVDFVHATRESDVDIPRIEGPRALLMARLAELEPTPPSRPSTQKYVSALAYVAALVLLMAGGWLVHQRRQERTPAGSGADALLLPNPNLTPGATQTVALSVVCSSSHEEVVRNVPARVSEAVFREYGISKAPASDYEVDYLITPGLGGADDIRNLWPEPHNNTVWNSYVKDQLEDRLHSMVCSGQVSLTAAQQEIAANWISAYKHYFHTERPLYQPSAEERGREIRFRG